VALANGQKGEKVDARPWFDKAVAWMREQDCELPVFRQLWAEAGALLGQPGPGAADTGPPLPSAVNKRD
jgi:hypothetical protein